MYEKMLVDTYPGFLSLRNECHQIVWLNANFRNWVALYTDVNPLGKTNTELAKLVPQNVGDTFLQCHDGSLDLASDSGREGLKKVIEFKNEDGKKESSQYFDVLKYKVLYDNESYIFTIAYDITDLFKENQLNYNTSMSDQLTNVYNRRHFEDHYTSYCNHNAAMFDLDNFKLINDNEGHLQGDIILKEFSSFLKNEVPNVISVSRLGGDEFLIVFKMGIEIDAINQSLIDLRIEFERKYEIYRYLSYSFGLCVLGENMSKTLSNLDKLMYLDKRRTKKI